MAFNTHSATSGALQSLFAYKKWANEELYASLASIGSMAHPAEVNNAIRILNHVYVVDKIFKANLEGVDHGYSATNTKDTPSIQELAAAVKDIDQWYVAYASGLASSALRERVPFKFTDGDAGLMSREEILLHVVTHGGYHRGAAGQVMRSVSVAPPRDLYTKYLHMTEPERRGA